MFYPIPYQVSFVRRRDSAAADLARLHAHAATVHVWTSVIKRQSEKEYKLAPGVKPHTEPGSILDLMLTELGMEGERFRDRV